MIISDTMIDFEINEGGTKVKLWAEGSIPKSVTIIPI